MQEGTRDPGSALAAEVAELIAARLHNRLGRQVRHFQVLAEGDGLVLQGQASTYYAKQVAQEVTRQVSGMAVLANRIEVG
jgi:osmotically-inducible protein OsmY